MADFSFEITEPLAVLSQANNGWTKEVNMVSFNGRPAKLDIRSWDPDHEKMSKGITLDDNEARLLLDALEKKLD